MWSRKKHFFPSPFSNWFCCRRDFALLYEWGTWGQIHMWVTLTDDAGVTSGMDLTHDLLFFFLTAARLQNLSHYTWLD